MRKEGIIETDILIVGAGPTGLFAVFEAGLLKMHCHLIDSLGQVGGQLSEIYPKKPIYDIPAYPSILAGELVDKLMEQIAPFRPGFTLGERAETMEKMEDGRFRVVTNRGTVHMAPVLVLAGGLGCFEPRKPPIDNITDYEYKGVNYIIRDPEAFRDRKVLIAGGGDSALDWSIYLSAIAAELSLVHRRTGFRGAPDSVAKVMQLAGEGKIRLITEAQVTGLRGDGWLEAVEVDKKGEGASWFDTDDFIPLFGLTPKLGPIANWGLGIEKNHIPVNTLDYSTDLEGVYAIGDINTYPGKLKLILSGFHEAALMAHSAAKIVFPEKKSSLKYTTITGIKGFEE